MVAVTMLRVSLDTVHLPKIWYKAKKIEKLPEGDPPEDALIDADGFFLVDKNGNYLTCE